MQHKKPEYFEMLERFIDEYKDANGGATPSLKEIARNIGLAESTVSKYLKVMREKGIVECEGRKNIITKQSRRDAEGFCRVPVLGAVACGIPKLAEENMTQYPVALPLIMSGMIDAGGYKVKYEDIFNEEFANDLPELFDSKEHDTDYINNYIYEKYGNINEKSLAADIIVTPAFFDEENEAMKDIILHLK